MSATDEKKPIAIDAMGSDKGPAEVVAAALLARERFPDLPTLTLVGDQDILRTELKNQGGAEGKGIDIFHASQVVDMDDKPIQSLKQKKDSSLVRAVELVKEGKAGAVISCGNTGALMAAGTIKVRPAQGIERPALGIVMPSQKDHFILIDAGANPEPRPTHLVHNAILGSNYCRVVLKKEKPRVGLLTIGTEEGKGNELIQETHDKLKKLGNIIDYHGLIEGFEVFENKVDVVVTDGFTGNILLKVSESLFYLLKGYLKEELTKTPIRMLGAFLAKGAFQSMKDQLSPEQYGGAPLLGLKGLVIKAHGSSNKQHISSGIGWAAQVLDVDMAAMVKNEVEQANATLKAMESDSDGENKPALNSN